MGTPPYHIPPTSCWLPPKPKDRALKRWKPDVCLDRKLEALAFGFKSLFFISSSLVCLSKLSNYFWQMLGILNFTIL